ncbi:m-phase inducer phosphatase [Binucleata daphniae]
MSENFLVEDEISLSSSDSSQYEKFICKTESNEIGDENTSFDMFFSSELCLSENITYKKLKEKSNEQTRMENKMYDIKLQKKLEKQNTRLTNLTFEESKARSDKTASENPYLTPSSYNSITKDLENTHDRCEQLDLKYPALLHNSNNDIQNISKPTNSIATNNDILIQSQIENMENASSDKNGIDNNSDILIHSQNVIIKNARSVKNNYINNNNVLIHGQNENISYKPNLKYNKICSNTNIKSLNDSVQNNIHFTHDKDKNSTSSVTKNICTNYSKNYSINLLDDSNVLANQNKKDIMNMPPFVSHWSLKCTEKFRNYSVPEPNLQKEKKCIFGFWQDYDAGVFHTLPTLGTGSSDSIHRISIDIVKNMLDTKINKNIVIIDCRFRYEYQGGHIKQAININTIEETERFYDASSTAILIFHCEYSSIRAPRLARCIRNKDRNANKYPNLKFPEIYIMEGGYKKFYMKYSKFCEPMCYVSMDDSNLQTENVKKYKKDTQ